MCCRISGGLTRLSGAPKDFHPRGLGIYRSPDGSGIFLLAVNRHAQAINDNTRFSIDSFEVTNPKTTPALVAQGTIEGGLLTDPQDVAAAGPGAFYVSNGSGGAGFPARPGRLWRAAGLQHPLFQRHVLPGRGG